ncbi:MAG: recombinase family protein [Clostridiales bacterium]
MKTDNKNSVPRNAWIYCRVASNEHNSIEIQRDRLIHFANERGFNIAGISQDIGSGLDFYRKGLSETKQAVCSKNADVVLVSNVSCIGRDTLKTTAYIKELNNLGAEFLSSTDGVIDMTLTDQLISEMSSMSMSENRVPKWKMMIKSIRDIFHRG